MIYTIVDTKKFLPCLYNAFTTRFAITITVVFCDKFSKVTQAYIGLKEKYKMINTPFRIETDAKVAILCGKLSAIWFNDT